VDGPPRVPMIRVDMHHLLTDIGTAVVAATLLGLIAHWTRQPIILGYLIAGALIGPVAKALDVHLIHDEHSVEILSEIGLILLLFVIGLEMNLASLLQSGRQLLVAGFGQFLVCAALGVAVFAVLGYGLSCSRSEGLYFALMCGLSSTAVVVKLLYDKAELDTLPGRMTLGVLVVQDIYAIFILAFQPNFANPTVLPVLKAIGGTVLLLGAGFLLSRYVLRWVFESIARSPEMVVAVSLGWCALVAATAGWLGLSKEMGALVAGLSIAAFPYSIHVTAKALPLRDFFLTLFFVSLGMQITPPTWSIAGQVLLLIGFVIASRFLSVYPLLGVSGAGRRTAFITSLNLSQISEFSLVIANLGVAYKHIAPETVGVMIYAMAIMAVLSSYTIGYNHQLYLAFDRLLQKLGRRAKGTEPAADDAAGAMPPVAILGFHRAARTLVDTLAGKSPELLKHLRVIDFNPETLRDLRGRGVRADFGDISSRDTLEHAHLEDAKLILCTIPDALLKGTDNQTLVRLCRHIAPHATIVATADDDRHARQLEAEGADVVTNSYSLVAVQLTDEVVRRLGELEPANPAAQAAVAANA
jgi:Kef-type K+ transport system membrane component KefB